MWNCFFAFAFAFVILCMGGSDCINLYVSNTHNMKKSVAFAMFIKIIVMVVLRLICHYVIELAHNHQKHWIKWNITSLRDDLTRPMTAYSHTHTHREKIESHWSFLVYIYAWKESCHHVADLHRIFAKENAKCPFEVTQSIP